MSAASDSLWLRPLSRSARGLVKLELKVHEIVWGGVLGVWVIALALGGLLAWIGVAPPELLFWVMPTLFGGILFAGRLGGSDRRQGTEEFSLALPVSRSLRYRVSVGVMLVAWLSLSLGGWFFLNLPIRFRELRDGGDRFVLNLNQEVLALAISFFFLCLTFFAFGTFRHSRRFETLAKQWPWAFFLFTFAGVTPIELGRDWPILYNLPWVVLGLGLLWLGHRRFVETGLSTAPERVGAWGYRLLRPVLDLPAVRRSLWYGELRTLDGSWAVLSCSFLIPSVILGILGDGIPRAYLPWVFLGVALLCSSGVATWVAGTRTDFDIEEFLGALPPARRRRFRVRFGLGLLLATLFFGFAYLVLRSGVAGWIVERLPEMVRRTSISAEAMPPLFNAETAFLLVPLVLHAFASSYYYSQRHRELGKDYSENAAGNAALVVPAIVVMLVRWLGAWQGVLWISLALLGLTATLSAVWFYRAAERRTCAVDLPETKKECGPMFWVLTSMLGGMVMVIFGFGYLMAVGEADRLGRFYAAGQLDADEFLARTHVAEDFGPWERFMRRARAECYALAEDVRDCESRDSRRRVRHNGQEREEIHRREDEYRESATVPWRFVRYVEEFGADTSTVEEFVERLQEAARDPDLEVADRGWFARSGRSLEDFKARQNEIRDRLGPLYGGRAEAR